MPGRPRGRRRAAACTARGYLPLSTRGPPAVPRRRARRGPGRAGAAAARRAVLLFPRGRRASLLGWRGVGDTLALWRAFFVEAVRGSVDLVRVFSRCPLSRGVVERPTKGGNAFSFASAATNARSCGCSPGLGRLPRCAALVRFPASRGAIRAENACKDRSKIVRELNSLHLLQPPQEPATLHQRNVSECRQAF